MAGERRARALGALYGLTLGDALGSQFFVPANRCALEQRQLPPAPLGAWFADDPAEAARQAALSARVTHSHPEGAAGAVAVAVAAALAACLDWPDPREFLDQVLRLTPPSRVHHGVWSAGAGTGVEPHRPEAALKART